MARKLYELGWTLLEDHERCGELVAGKMHEGREVLGVIAHEPIHAEPTLYSIAEAGQELRATAGIADG